MTHEIRVEGSNLRFEAEEGETVLEAAERAGYALPYSCRKGVCASCEGVITAGHARVGRNEIAAGPAAGVKFCIARPQEALTIAPTQIELASIPLRKTFDATIQRIHRPVEDVAILHLRLPIGRRAPFRAGQYAAIQVGDGETRNYSLANAPYDNQSVELHVRRVPGGRFSDLSVSVFAAGDVIRLELPYGRFTLNENRGWPIVMLATGTGFAPLKSIVEDLRRRRMERPVALYWGGRTESDLYHKSLVAHWAERFPWFRFIPVLSEPGQGWEGRTGLVQENALLDHPDLSHCEVYACGNPAMVEASQRLLTSQGKLLADAFYADAFVPSGGEPAETRRELVEAEPVVSQ